MSRWLTLTLLLTAGCYAEHGLDGRRDAGRSDGSVRDAGIAWPDAPPIADAGLCRALPTFIEGLRCPATAEAGAPVIVELTHSASACCGEDAARIEATRTGERGIVLTPSWDSCGCCEDCECVGPRVTQSIDVGPLSEGIWTVATDRAMGCTIVVGEFECVGHPVEAAIVPDASPIDEPLPVLLQASGLSCGCTPRGTYYMPREGPAFVGLERCSCSDEDPCVDAGYEATALVPVPPFERPFTANTDVGPITSQIVDPSRCGGGMRVVGVAPIGIDPDVIHDAPVHVFADVTYEASYCCSPPTALARALPSAGFPAYELLNCTLEDCDCIGPVRTLSAVVHLGTIAPGTTMVQLGGFDFPISIP